MIEKIKQNLRGLQEIVMLRFVVLILPFGIISVLWASEGSSLRFSTLFWVVMAIVSARNIGMLFDRYIDKDIDGKNPLTKERAIPQGRVSTPFVWGMILLNTFLMAFSAYELNILCLYLSPLVILFLVAYPYTKRYTILSHFTLGLILSLAPVGAWIAIRGELTTVPLFLGFSVLCWVSGFDIMYHMEDIEFYEKEDLYSIPKVLGIKKAKFVSIALYLTSILLLLWIGKIMSFSGWYFLGTGLGAVSLAYQQYFFRSSKTLRKNKVFLLSNIAYSFLLLFFAILEYSL